MNQYLLSSKTQQTWTAWWLKQKKSRTWCLYRNHGRPGTRTFLLLLRFRNFQILSRSKITVLLKPLPETWSAFVFIGLSACTDEVRTANHSITFVFYITYLDRFYAQVLRASSITVISIVLLLDLNLRIFFSANCWLVGNFSRDWIIWWIKIVIGMTSVTVKS